MGVGGRGRGQGGCERRIIVFVKIQKKNYFLGGSGGGSGGQWEGSGWGGQGGCERRIEVFVKIQKKNWGGPVGGGSVAEGVRLGGGVGGAGSGWM